MIASVRVALPNLDERIRQRRAVRVEHSTREVHDLATGLADAPFNLHEIPIGVLRSLVRRRIEGPRRLLGRWNSRRCPPSDSEETEKGQNTSPAGAIIDHRCSSQVLVIGRRGCFA